MWVRSHYVWGYIKYYKYNENVNAYIGVEPNKVTDIQISAIIISTNASFTYDLF